jgi:PAS domain S-box-containing protein
MAPGVSGDPRRSRVRLGPTRYGVALAAAAAAFFLRLALTPLIGRTELAFSVTLPAVLLAGWFGGLGPGVLCVLVSGLVSAYYFAEPVGSFLVNNQADQLSFVIFLVLGLGVVWLGDSQRRAVDRALRAENAERLERQRFETTLRSIGDAVVATDPQGRVTFANRIALSLLRWPEQEIFGRPLGEVFRIVNEETRATVESPGARVLRDGGIVGLANHTILIARDGTEVPIDDSAAPVQGSDGVLQGTVLVFRDITERRRAETAGRLLALRETDAELARVLRALSVNELATSIAHEVNQPLAGVVTNAEAALRWLSAHTPDLDEAKQSLALIVRDANRASAVIRRIREFLKKGNPLRASIDTNEVIQEAVALSSGEIAKANVQLRMRLAGDLPRVNGDRIQLQQVILNLILNAVEAMRGSPEPRELLVSSGKSSDGGVSVAVRDSGAGIDPQNMPHIFEAFFTTKPTGIGMGLSICRSILEAHGGRIWLEANEGRGVTGQFSLPAEGGAEKFAAASEES